MGNTSSIELPVALVQHTNQQLPINIESGLVVLVFNSYDASQSVIRRFHRYDMLIREFGARGYVVIKAVPTISQSKTVSHKSLIRTIESQKAKCVAELKLQNIDLTFGRTTIVCVGDACEWIYRYKNLSIGANVLKIAEEQKRTGSSRRNDSVKKVENTVRLNIPQTVLDDIVPKRLQVDNVVLFDPTVEALKFKTPMYDVPIHVILFDNNDDKLMQVVYDSCDPEKTHVDKVDVGLDSIEIKSRHDSNRIAKHDTIRQIVDLII